MAILTSEKLTGACLLITYQNSPFIAAKTLLGKGVVGGIRTVHHRTRTTQRGLRPPVSKTLRETMFSNNFCIYSEPQFSLLKNENTNAYYIRLWRGPNEIIL